MNVNGIPAAALVQSPQTAYRRTAPSAPAPAALPSDTDSQTAPATSGSVGTMINDQA